MEYLMIICVVSIIIIFLLTMVIGFEKIYDEETSPLDNEWWHDDNETK